VQWLQRYCENFRHNGMRHTEASMDSSTSPSGRRASRMRATRRALQQAALALIAERGPDAVTVEDICAVAGVSPRTFFNYFASKEQAIIDWDPELDAYVCAAVAQRPAGESPLRAIRAVLGESVADAMSLSGWQERLLLIRAHPSLIARLVEVMSDVRRALARGIAARTGLPEHHLYVELTAASAITALRTALEAWSGGPPGTDPAPLVDQAFAYLESGFTAPLR
jgi:AcrR family transcriptional regulator